jgi:hypothetical protein
MKQHVVYLGIIILLILIIFRAECGKPEIKREEIKVDGKRYEVIKVKTDTVYVKVRPEVYFKEGKTIYRDTTIYQKTPVFGIGGLAEELEQQFYDSIMLEYYAKRVFSDTIRFGEYGNVYIKDTIQENSILNRTSKSDLKFPQATNTTVVKEKPKNQLYLGARGIINNGTIHGVGSGLILKTKRDRLYGVGAIIDRQKNVNFTFDFHIKL